MQRRLSLSQILLVASLVLPGCSSIEKTSAPQAADAQMLAVATSVATTVTPSAIPRPPDQSVFKAAARGDLRAIQKFADEGGGLDLADTQGLTLLMFACRRGQIDIARYLLKSGANPDTVDRDKTAVIHYASAGPSREIAGLVLDAGADASVTDRLGYNALLIWAERDDWDLIERALSRLDRLKYLKNVGTELADAAEAAGQTKILATLRRAGFEPKPRGSTR